MGARELASRQRKMHTGSLAVLRLDVKECGVVMEGIGATQQQALRAPLIQPFRAIFSELLEGL